MKRTRIWSAVVLGGVLLGLLAGCAQEQSAIKASEQRDLAQVRQSGVLRWGSDEAGGAPFEFRDPNNPTQRIGFEVEIADELARRLGVKIEFVQTDWAALIPALNRGDFDIAMSGIEVTEDRKRVADFSRPYYLYLQQLVVRSDDTISSLSQCVAKKVGTLNNTAAERLLKTLEGVEVQSYDDNVRPYEDLAIGRIDAVLLDLPIALYHAKGNPKLKFAGEPCAPGEYAIAISKTAPELRKAVDQALDEMIADGTLRKILEKWQLWNDAQAKL